MKHSLQIGRPFGIKISIHWTFLFLIAWVVIIDIQQGLNFKQTMLSILFILVLFVCVVLHELGHSFTAMRFGADVKSITLLPIGGMANISKLPETPKEELLMTIAGPAVNVVIALILYVIISAFGNVDFQEIDFTAITGENFLTMLLFVNLFIVAFNLIPAFPMDGGRILRALFSFRMDKLKATRLAKITGQAFALTFMIVGLFINPFLVIIGIFVFLGASAEYKTLKFTELLKFYTVSEAIITDYHTVHPEAPLEKAAEQLLHHQINGIIVTRGNEPLGILTKNDIIKGLSMEGKNIPVKQVMSVDFETVGPSEPLDKVFQRMQGKKSLMVPVMKNDRILGILDMDALQQFILVKSALNE